MGKTVPSYRMVLESEIKKWEPFLKALRKEDREAFEELINECRRYASAAGAAVRPIISEAMFMSILLSHQKSLKEFKAALERLKSALQPQQ
ncbi:hypothetical protein KEJ18_03290 [Candidatus Bathyarchaeota archaeon]|nr:hypothetical protein [Candidatus Bathyarchaeota archaeon]